MKEINTNTALSAILLVVWVLIVEGKQYILEKPTLEEQYVTLDKLQRARRVISKVLHPNIKSNEFTDEETVQIDQVEKQLKDEMLLLANKDHKLRDLKLEILTVIQSLAAWRQSRDLSRSDEEKVDGGLEKANIELEEVQNNIRALNKRFETTMIREQNLEKEFNQLQQELMESQTNETNTLRSTLEEPELLQNVVQTTEKLQSIDETTQNNRRKIWEQLEKQVEAGETNS